MLLAPVTHILALTTILRERLLPVPGVVTVRLNQRVSASDVVAEGRWAREHLLLDVGRKLGVSTSVADRLIRCNVDDKLAVNALIASKASTGGVFRREVRSPQDGRVVLVGGGRVLMEVGEVNVELRAGLPGQVMKIIPDRGVAIQTTGALVQGVWGNGRIETGMLVNLMEKSDSMIEAGRLDGSLRGSVILAGMLSDADVLHAAAELPVRGLILSSMHPSLIPLALVMRYPILVMEGFGSFPMNSAAYRLLTTIANPEATVNAETFDRYSGGRPEVIVPLPVSVEPAPPNDLETFASGQQVLLRAVPYIGRIASIIRLRPGLTTLPSGLRVPAADVRMENGEEILVPLANMEVVG
jgi:hypothetical protein